MDELRRHAASLAERWQRFARGQRVAVIVGVIASAVGFSWLISRDSAEWQPICGGREFSTNELSAIQSAWREQGLKTFRRDGHSLSVPKAEASRYEAVIPKLKSNNTDTGTEWEKQLARTNFFTTSEQLEQHKDNALRNELRRVLKAIPAIADVDVIWARSKTRSAFAARSKVTASINVLPRDGHDLTPELAQSLRTAVARMVPDLSEADIAVLDQSTGLTMTDESDQLVSTQQRHRQHERLTKQLEAKLRATLADVPGAIVEVEWTAAESSSSKNGAPKSHPYIAAKPVFGQGLIDWHNDAPGKLIELTTFSEEKKPSSSLAATESDTSPAGRIAVRVPQAYFDALFARHWLDQRHQRGPSFEVLCSAECSRLKRLLQSSLPTDVPAAAVTVVADQQLTSTAMHATATPFAAWPHVAGTSIALLCIVAALRPRPRQQAPRASAAIREPATDRSPTDEHVIVAPPESVPDPIDEPNVVASVLSNKLEIPTLDELTRLQQLDPERLAEALRLERPQAIAVLLTRFPTRLASACLSRLTSSAQTDVIRRLKSLGAVPDELVTEIARAVCQRLSPEPEQPAREPTNRIGHLLPESSTRRVFA
jgi:flagellar biosynthesis/type III secretory pathway M-ring protein FliF/YscJ